MDDWERALSLAELAVAPVPAGGRNPGGEEVCAEGQDEVGVLDVEVGEDVLLVDVLDGGAVDVIVHGLELQVLDAGGLGETVRKHPQVAAHGLGDHDGVVAAVVELAGEGVHPLWVPGNGVELAGAAVAAALHWAGDAVGMIEGLDASLATGVGLALVGGVEGIALHLLGAAFHHSHQDALAGRAVAAEAGVPVVLAADEVLGQADGGLDAEFALPDAEALAGHGAESAQAGPCQEMSPS